MREKKLNRYVIGFLSVSFTFLITSCTREVEKPASIKIQLPETGQVFNGKSQSQKISTQSNEWGIADPSSYSDIDCYSVFVSAPDLNQGICVDSSGVQKFTMGFLAGPFASGSGIEIDVPAGSQRVVRLVGMKSADGLCVSSDPTNTHSHFSAPFEVGESSPIELAAGSTNTIQISAQFIATGKFHSCTGPELGFGPPPDGTTQPPPLTLTGTPPAYSNTTVLNIGVSGSDVTDYKYKIGPDANIDCSTLGDYGNFIPIGTPITDNILGIADGLVEICVLGRDSSGVEMAIPESYVFTKDTISPTVSIDTPATANSTNAANFSFSGSCSEEGQPIAITISGAASGSAACSSGIWTAGNIDISSAADSASVTIHADHADMAGNNAAQATNFFQKDTLAPTAPTLSIDGGATNTTSTTVSLTLGATQANDFYATNTAGCNAGGTYTAYTTTFGWTLVGGGGVQTVYVKYRDVAGNETACISDTITHDTPAQLEISNGPTYDFGTIANGSVVSHIFTVSNSGSLGATAISETGLAAPFSFLGGAYPGTGGDCVTSLATGAACSIVVQYSPVATGVDADTINLSYNDGLAANNSTRNIQGTSGAPAVIAITPGGPFNFGNRATGSTINQTFTLTNNGAVTATGLSDPGALVTPFEYAGGGAFPGSGGTCTATLTAASNCTIVISYTPITLGAHADSILVDYNDGANAQQASNDLQGTGAPPASLSISETDPYNYGTVPVSGSQSHTFILTNAGGTTATSLTSAATLPTPWRWAGGGAFPGSGGDCVATLAPAANCNISVEFTPSTDGAESYTLTLSYDSGVTTVESTRDVTGTAVPGISYMALGHSHTCYKDTNNAGWCFGSDQNLQLGDGAATINSNTAVSISGNHDWVQLDSYTNNNCGVTFGNDIYCWGENTYGQLGDGTMGDSSIPVQVSGAQTWAKVVVGTQHACGLDTGGNAYCWGRNDQGQLGNNDLGTDQSTPVALAGSPGTFIDISSNGNHTCGVTTGNAIKCWGNANNGQLGDGGTSDIGLPVDATLFTGSYTSVVTGGNHTCAILAGGAAECIGAGNSGQLGNNGGVDHVGTIANVTGANWSKLVAGINYTCGYKSSSGQIFCWGSDSTGQQGNGAPTADVNAPAALTGTNWVDVFAGYTHACGKKIDGTTYCWGFNSFGQIGDQTTTNAISPVQATP